jgi:thiamine monophosphate synthase
MSSNLIGVTKLRVTGASGVAGVSALLASGNFPELWQRLIGALVTA